MQMTDGAEPCNGAFEEVRDRFGPVSCPGSPPLVRTLGAMCWLCLELTPEAFAPQFDSSADRSHIHVQLSDRVQLGLNMASISHLLPDLQDVLHRALLRHRLEGGS